MPWMPTEPPPIEPDVEGLDKMATFARDFFATKLLRAVVLLTCTQKEAMVLVRALQTIAPVAHVGSWVTGLGRTPAVRLGVIVDLDCAGGGLAVHAGVFFSQASHDGALGGAATWLAWTWQTFSHHQATLEQLNFTFDSDFTLAKKTERGGLELFDIYKVARGRPIQRRRAGRWSPGGGLRVRGHDRDRDLQGLRLRAAIVLHQLHVNVEDQDAVRATLLSHNNTHLDSETRFGVAMLSHLADMLNFTVEMRITESWGYAQPNGSFDGMIGMLQRGEIDVGLTPAVLTKERLRVVDFTTQTWKLRTCFIFRHPRLLVPYRALVDPMQSTTWLGVGIVSAAIVVALWTVRRWEHLEDGVSRRDCFGDAVITVIGILSQQGAGAVLECRSLAGRVVLLFALLLSIVLLCFYTSAIVYSLLTPIPRTIRTVQDLILSPLQVGLEDYAYTKAVFPKSKDPLTATLYNAKILADWPEGGFFAVADGISRVRRGLFAFFSEDSTLYRPIMDTFSDDEKCSLSEVELNPAFITATTLLKRSPYKEYFNRRLLVMLERGLRARLRALWSAQRPGCTKEAMAVLAVGLDPIFPAHAVLLIGAVASLCILLVERCHYSTVTAKPAPLSSASSTTSLRPWDTFS